MYSRTHSGGEFVGFDLILTDMDANTSSSTLPAMSDNLCTIISFSLKVICSRDVVREVWFYGVANWNLFRRLCREEDWSYLVNVITSVGGAWFHDRILAFMKLSIPTHTISKASMSHPWVNDRRRELVRGKVAVVGIENYVVACETCSKGFVEEYLKYVTRTQKELSNLPRGSKLR